MKYLGTKRSLKRRPKELKAKVVKVGLNVLFYTALNFDPTPGEVYELYEKMRPPKITFQSENLMTHSTGTF